MPRRGAAGSKSEKAEKLTSEDIKHIDDSVFSAKTLVNMAIYAVLEAPQELYFGSHSEKNVNILEKVLVRAEIREGNTTRVVDIEKPYFSPTKQRGIERRAIAYSLVKTNDGRLMPYYKYFNLSIDVTNTYPSGKPDPRDILTYVWGATWTTPTAYLRGRVGYGGGVAIQPSTVLTKQRNRVEYRHFEVVGKEESEAGKEAHETAQMVWSKEYAEPHVLIPVYRSYTLLGNENYEPHAVAYAFLRGLELAGAGTPKGISILEAYWLSNTDKEKALVVDVGASLLPEPVVVSPAIVSVIEALEEFKSKALSLPRDRKSFENPKEVFDKAASGTTCRLVGNSAYRFLRTLAEAFEKDYLLKIEELNISRVQTCRNQHGRGGGGEAG